MRERLSINEVAEIIGESPNRIRVKCARNMYDPPICRVHKGKKNNHYLFYRSLVNAYVGKEKL